MPVYADIGVEAALLSPLDRNSCQGWLQIKGLPEVLGIALVTQRYAAIVPHSLRKTCLASHATWALQRQWTMMPDSSKMRK